MSADWETAPGEAASPQDVHRAAGLLLNASAWALRDALSRLLTSHPASVLRVMESALEAERTVFGAEQGRERRQR